MLVYHPVFHKDDSMYVFSTWTTPLLKEPARLYIGDEVCDLEEGPSYELVGTPIWSKAVELASLGRELHQRLVYPEVMEGTASFLASMSRGDVFAEAALKFLSRFRPALEQFEPVVLFAFRLSGSGHAPMNLELTKMRMIKSFLREHRVLGLFHQEDAPYFTGIGVKSYELVPHPREEGLRGPDASEPSLPELPIQGHALGGGFSALKYKLPPEEGYGSLDKGLARPQVVSMNPPSGRTREGAQAIEPLQAWKAWRALVDNKKKPPYALEKTVLTLPPSYWMKSTAEFLGMIPLKWADSGGFFHGSPSAHSWGDVLSKVAPSYGFSGRAEELFPVPILSGSLLDIALSSHREEIFLNLNSRKPIPSRHILATGPTGTGKTLLGTFALINECLERKQPVIYLGPTRMLVEDAAQEFKRLLTMLEKGLGKGVVLIKRDDIIVSTGETFQDDARIANGDFRAAFVVYEKVSNFFIGSDLVKHLGMALIDELHMLGDRTRGGSLDATLARLVFESRTRALRSENPLRVICLSTGAMAEDETILSLLSSECEEGASEENLGGGLVTSALNSLGAKDGSPSPASPRSSKRPPLVLSVYERPQRLLMYVQPTASRYRFRPIHVSRLQDRLELSDLILDQGEGMSFENTLDGWIPGHEKLIYASYSWNSLLSFVNKMLRLGRSIVSSIEKDSFFLKDLELSLVRSGFSERTRDFYLRCAERGIFFHFSGLEKETRRLMAEGYRRFRPVSLEPFILCATETISYGVNLPADALFLETVMWPRSRFDRFYSIESLTNNEFKNLVGRVGRHGHIKPGIIPTVVVNWKMGRDSTLRKVFPERKRDMERLCSSQPVSKIDCHELEDLLARRKPPLSVSKSPAAAGRFLILAFLHACSIKGGDSYELVTIKDMEDFLNYTYTFRSLLGSSKNEREQISLMRDLRDNIRDYFKALSESFGDLIVKRRDTASNQRAYIPGKLAINLARNGTNPLTLTELDSFMKLDVESSRVGESPTLEFWTSPQLFGLKALLLSPLCSENRGVFSRGRFDPSALRLAKDGLPGLSSPDDEKEVFRYYATPLTQALHASGLALSEAQAMSEHIASIVERIVTSRERHMELSTMRRLSLRDRLLPYVYRVLLSLFLWVSGIHISAILKASVVARRLQILGQQSFLNLKENMGVMEAFSKELEFLMESPERSLDYEFQALKPKEPKIPELKDKDDPNPEEEAGGHAIDGQAFDRRFTEKIVLVLDSFLEYIAVDPQNAPLLESLKAMIERVRYGLTQEELEKYLPSLEGGGGLSREEWLRAEKQPKAVEDDSPQNDSDFPENP
ncbi:MAG: DEAD/DEAH box helicase [Deltaproteobacteria bacterium]|jgi:hypothetical protein|nr:DEAD/DEAH box helicase [Deltaproteobacteria bacterium]